MKCAHFVLKLCGTCNVLIVSFHTISLTRVQHIIVNPNTCMFLSLFVKEPMFELTQEYPIVFLPPCFYKEKVQIFNLFSPDALQWEMNYHD